MGIVWSKLKGSDPSRSKSPSTSIKKWHGLVFPVNFLHCDDKIFDGDYQPEEEELEDESQVYTNNDTITFIGQARFTPQYLMMGIFKRFKVKFVPQNVVLKVNCYPNIAICIKLSGSKEENAMVKFLCCKLIADQKRMEFYNKIALKVRNQDSRIDECQGNQIQIKVLTLNGKRMPFKVDPTATIYELKLRIQNRERISPDQIRIIFQGKEVDNDRRTLADYGIGDEDTVHTVFDSKLLTSNRMRGGKGSFLDLTREMLCPICQQLLFAPVVLNCKHIFCQHCIGEAREEERKAKRKDKCPYCFCKGKSPGVPFHRITSQYS